MWVMQLNRAIPAMEARIFTCRVNSEEFINGIYVVGDDDDGQI